MEPIRLWRVPIEHGELAWWFDPPLGNGTEYAALPRADFDAREARLARAEQERDEARASAAVAGRLLDEHRNGCVWMTWHKEATARADKAEKDRDDARALLREAKEHVESVTLRERIDDALNRKHAERGPEPEGREGGDGAGEGGRE